MIFARSLKHGYEGFPQFCACPKRYAAVMGLADAFLKEEDEAPDDANCSGNPYECHCERVLGLVIDIEGDQEFDEAGGGPTRGPPRLGANVCLIRIPTARPPFTRVPRRQNGWPGGHHKRF